MIELWYVIVCFTFLIFVVMDGWNFGIAALHLIAARTVEERREVIAAVGPLWSWHEVWLLASGGTLLMAFPKVMATAFAGYYLALWLVLWCFILRGVSIEVGGHIHDSMWQKWWDFVFGVASVLLAVLFGTAIGNVIRGVPIGPTGKFSLALFTDFGVRGEVGILDWYSVLVAVFTVVLLGAHGATYLTLKTRGKVHARSERIMRGLWTAALPMFVVITAATWYVRPDMFAAMARRPVAWVAILIVVGAMTAILIGLTRKREVLTFVGSCGVIVGLLAAFAVSVFPVMLYSTISPEYSLTAYGGAAHPSSLRLAIFWWPIGVGLAITYFVFILRHYRGKVRPAEDTQGFS